MTDAEFEIFQRVADEIERKYNTEELATQFLQAAGIVGLDGELMEHDRDTACV